MSAAPTTASASQLKSHRAYAKVLDWIKDGRYGVGERLPSERDLAQMLGLNHLTVRRGLARLVDEGVIEKRPNVGNFVVESNRLVSLALILPEYLHGNHQSGHPGVSLVTAGACSALDPLRYSLSTLYYKFGRLWDDAGRAVVKAGAEGVLLAPDSSVRVEQVQRLLDRGIRVVMLQDVPSLASLGLPAVQPDHEMALLQLVHGLAERGHRRVRVAAYTSNPLQEVVLATLRIALEQTGLGSMDELLLSMPNPPGTPLAESYRVLTDVLTSDAPPTAIIVPDEYAAAHLFQSCYRLGVRVPQDLSIASVLDQTPLAYPVPLAAPDSVQVARMVGQVAALQLTDLVRGAGTVQRKTLLRNDVVWRESVADVSSA